MTESPYHWRDFAADEEKADVVRTMLGMPDLEFESSDLEMFVWLEDPPTPEVYERLKRMGCTLETIELGVTRLSFAHRKHLADSVLKTLNVVRYVLMFASVATVCEMMRSAYYSEFFST
jgi:hypothetical protein